MEEKYRKAYIKKVIKLMKLPAEMNILSGHGANTSETVPYGTVETKRLRKALYADRKKLRTKLEQVNKKFKQLEREVLLSGVTPELVVKLNAFVKEFE